MTQSQCHLKAARVTQKIEYMKKCFENSIKIVWHILMVRTQFLCMWQWMIASQIDFASKPMKKKVYHPWNCKQIASVNCYTFLMILYTMTFCHSKCLLYCCMAQLPAIWNTLTAVVLISVHFGRSMVNQSIHKFYSFST